MKKQIAVAVLVLGAVTAIVPIALSSGDGDGDGEPTAAVQGRQLVCHLVDGAPFDYFELLETDAEGALGHIESHSDDFAVADAAECANVPVLVCDFADGTYTVVETDPAEANERLLNPTGDLLAVDASCPEDPEPPVDLTAAAPDDSEPESAPAGDPPATAGSGDSEPTAEETGETADTAEAAEAEVLGRSSERLAETALDSSDLAAVGFALVAVGLVMLWRVEERQARP